VALTPGSRIGAYEIAAQIGAGGMGEVYRATDTNLKRQVAIKVLPESLAGDTERLARFQREAEVLAALNHPNIASIYGLDRTDGHAALVMELVEGPTLADRLAQGPLPVEEALPITRQIAEALEAAHEQGIVHRDLKPANIKLRPDGTVKVLDFGLAKAMDPASELGASAGQALSMSPTMTTPAMTQAGVILGTAAYMAPEQVRGTQVDARADVWAFGVVLYEMLTGRGLFRGDTVSDVMASVLRSEPDWDAVPAEFRRLLRRCLARDRNQRLRHVADLDLLLDDTTGESGTTVVASGRSWVGPAVLAALLAGTVGAVGTIMLRGTPTPGPMIFQELPPEGNEFAAAPLPSPDGRALAMRATDEQGVTRIWVRPLDVEQPQMLAGTEGADLAIWSPDSEQIAFHADGALKRVASRGGPVQLIASLDSLNVPGGGVWTEEGNIIVSSLTQGIVTVPAIGGTVRTILQREGTRYISLRPVPGIDRIVFAEFGGEETGLYSADLGGGDRTLLLSGEVNVVRQVDARTLVYLQAGLLVAQRLAGGGHSLEGDPVPVAEQVAPELVTDSFSRFSNRYDSATGSLTVLPISGGSAVLTWFDREGQQRGVEGAKGLYEGVSLSPDGQTLVFVRSDQAGNRDVWVGSLAQTGAAVRLTDDPGTDHNAVFSPDGRRVAWEAHGAGDPSIMVRPVDRSEDAIRIRQWGRAGGVADWSPDGEFLLYYSDDGQASVNIWAVPIDGRQEPVPLLNTRFDETVARISPAGGLLAYVSNETGNNEVYVQRIEGMTRVGEPRQLSGGRGGDLPVWRADGAELFFRSRGRLMAATISSRADDFTAGPVQELFALSNPEGLTFQPVFWPTPDGSRFLVITSEAQETRRPATVMLNWTASFDDR